MIAACSILRCSGFDGADDVLRGEMTSVGTLGAGGDGAASAASANWSCLGGPPAVAPSVTGSGNVSYAVVLRSLLGAPLNNVVTKVCQAADINCATPLGESRGLTPDGLLAVQVPVGFAGFLEIQADGHVPTLYQLREPVLRNTVDTQPLQPLPTAGLAQLSGLLSIETVPELGLVSVAVVDCGGQRAPGAAFNNNLGGRIFYFSDGVPSVVASATDISGLGGFINVPIRLVEITAQLQADGRVIGTRTVLPRPGWLAVVQVRPPALPFD